LSHDYVMYQTGQFELNYHCVVDQPNPIALGGFPR